jgi:hypothetical protein
MELLSSLSKLFSGSLDSVVIYLSIRQCQKDGIWAWDCVENEPVLLIPMVLALLSDNPMQSEFACHIGLKGKLFCRACWVKGTDARAETIPEHSDSPHANSHDSEVDAMSETGSAGGSETSDGNGDEASHNKMKGHRKRALESMSNMVPRVEAFVKVKIFNDFGWHILPSIFRSDILAAKRRLPLS